MRRENGFLFPTQENSPINPLATKSDNNKALSISGWITLALVAASIEPILVKLSYQSNVTPLQLLALKNIMGALLILPITRTLKWIGWSETGKMLIASVLLFCTNYLTLIAIKELPVVLVITIVTTTPAAVALANSALGRDLLSKKFWLGFLLCFLGIILTLDFSSAAFTLLGLCCALGAVLSSSTYRVQMESLTSRYSPLLVSTYTFLFNGLFTAAFLMPLVIDIPTAAIPLGAWMGLSGALANVAFLSALNLVGSTRISIFTMLQRPLLLILAMIFLKETTSFSQMAGIVMVFFGVQLAQVTRKSATIETPSHMDTLPPVTTPESKLSSSGSV